MAKLRVLLTGSAGGVGTLFRERCGDRFEFVCFDRKPTPGVPGAIVGSLTDLEALTAAAKGCDVLVHLGAYPMPADFMRVILPDNIIGGYHAFEAARRAGVRRIVYASSVQVEPHLRSVAQAPAPANVYAASKAFGEHLGAVYAHEHGLEVVCLRLGLVDIPSKRERLRDLGELPHPIAVTANDCAEIIARAVETPDVKWAVLPAYSRNAAGVKDLAPLKDVLGFEPVEDAFVLYPRRWSWRRLQRLRYRARRWWVLHGVRPGARLRRFVLQWRPPRRVLLTGAAGHIATMFRAWAGSRYEFVCFDRVPVPGVPDAIVGDLADFAAVRRACTGCDAVLHLGGVRDEADFLSALLPANVVGSWNVYEAAGVTGAANVAFASTLQVEAGWHGHPSPVSVAMPARPRNLYAVSKLLGEDLGRAAAWRHGLAVTALRLGWVRTPTDPEWTNRPATRPPRITLTEGDTCRILDAALRRRRGGFALVPAYSRSARAVKDLAPLLCVLGLEPQDDPVAEFDRAAAPAAQR